MGWPYSSMPSRRMDDNKEYIRPVDEQCPQCLSIDSDYDDGHFTCNECGFEWDESEAD